MGACSTRGTRGVGVPCYVSENEDSDSDSESEGSFAGVDKGTFVRSCSRPGRFAELYDERAPGCGPLGKGGFGEVFRARHRATGQVRAVKRVSRTRERRGPWDEGTPDVEIQLLKHMDHPNVVRLFGSFEDRTEDHWDALLVMEFCRGGSLHGYLRRHGALPEALAARVARDMLRAIRYVHGRGVVHRDVKPENLLLEAARPLDGTALKLADFGTACVCRPGEELRMCVGTTEFMAPEVVASGPYGRECDFWSAGATLYTALAGELPFVGASEEEVLSRIRMGIISFVRPTLASASAAAKDVLRGLMAKNPRSRWTCADVLSGPWLRVNLKQEDSECEDSELLRAMTHFARLPALEKAVLLAVAYNSVGGLLDPSTFLEMNRNCDGDLTVQDLREGLRKRGIHASPQDLLNIIKAVDVNGDGRLEYSEFLAAALRARCQVDEGACRGAFEVFDLDGDGRISYAEAERVLLGQQHLLGASAKEALRAGWLRADLNGDGSLELREFMALLHAPLVLASAGA